MNARLRTVLDWVMWSPRNAVLAATAVLLGALALGALLVLRWWPADAEARGPVDTSTCQSAATAFTDTFLDRTRSSRAWREALTPLLTPAAAARLADVPRANLPTGRTSGVEAVTQPGACDAVTVLDDGTSITLELVEAPGGWRVASWGDGP